MAVIFKGVTKFKNFQLADRALTGTPYESSAYIIDGYGVSLAKHYGASRSNRDFLLHINADTGSTDLTGDTYEGAIRGRLVIGTTQSNASLMGVVGCVDVGASKNIQGNVFGLDGVLDFYGASTAGTGAAFYAGAGRFTVWNEGTTTVGAGGVLCGIDICQNSGIPTLGSGAVNPAIHVRASALSEWQYGIYMTNVKRVFYSTASLTGSTALDAFKMDVTDTTTISTGYQHGIYINWTKTGAQTGGAINPLSIDFAATTANCTEVALESHHITQTGNKLTGNVFGWQIYCEDLGTGVANVCLIDLGIVAGTHTASRLAFMRATQHATAKRMDEVFYIEGTSNYCATNLFTFCGCNTADDLLQSGTTLSGGIVGRLKVLVENTPGAGGTTMYIPLYTS